MPTLGAIAAWISALFGVTFDLGGILIAAVCGALAFFLIFTPKGKILLTWFLRNFIGGTLDASKPLVEGLSGGMSDVVGAFVAAGNAHGGQIGAQLKGPFADVAKKGFSAVTDGLLAKGLATPDKWKEHASEAMADAYGFGLTSAGITAAFEALFPEKLNVLNGTAAMIGTLAGFAEVSDAALGPLMAAAIKKPATYDLNSKFRPNLPAEMAVSILYSRGLIDRIRAAQLLAFAGYNDTDIDTLLTAAFRPLSPFVIRGGMSTGILSDAEMRDAMTYMGLRPGDQDKMIEIGKALALQRYQDSYVAAATSGFAKGIVGDDEFREVLADAKYTPEKAALATWTALLKRREVFATEVETQVVGLVAAGLMTPDEGLSQLEASGVQEWQARTKITLATTKAALTAARIEASAERRAALQQQRNLTRVAVDQYKVGTINEVELTAALIAIGLSPSLVAATVSMASAERAGRMTFAFGLVLPRQDAEVLRQQVNAVEAQMKKQLITIDAARASLAALKLPADEIDALISRWAAGIAKPSTTGILTPT